MTDLLCVCWLRVSGLSPRCLPLCFRCTCAVSGPVCEPLSAVSHINGDRRSQILSSSRRVQSYDISPTLCVLSPRRSAGYTQKRLTENLKVPYYVGEQFSKEVTGVNLKNVERTVEDDYISNLRNNCWKEKQQSMFAKKNKLCLFIYLFITPEHCCCCHHQFWEDD